MVLLYFFFNSYSHTNLLICIPKLQGVYSSDSYTSERKHFVFKSLSIKGQTSLKGSIFRVPIVSALKRFHCKRQTVNFHISYGTLSKHTSQTFDPTMRSLPTPSNEMNKLQCNTNRKALPHLIILGLLSNNIRNIVQFFVNIFFESF